MNIGVVIQEMEQLIETINVIQHTGNNDQATLVYRRAQGITKALVDAGILTPNDKKRIFANTYPEWMWDADDPAHTE